jgi:1-aminocyclopropane-1-carboxylate deaminase/D-cysteine desulfhydrase-like pyridoxal-dependent ACC family enzyme
MIVYADLCRLDHQKNGLEKLMRQRLPGRTEYLHSLEELKKRIQSSVYNIDIMVIHVGSTSPIPELLEYQDDLKQLNIILILSGITADDQIAQLLRLYPRYMTFDSADDTIISLLEQRIAQ